MVRGVTYTVYVLPIVFSIVFGSIVMVDVLQESGRELNLMRFGSMSENTNNENIEIFGLKTQYSISEPIEIQISVNDPSFSCGDLYVTIYSSGKEKAVTQSGYFKQCFDADDSFLPIDDDFSEKIETPGNYEIVVDILDKNQKNSITTSEKFTVK